MHVMHAALRARKALSPRVSNMNFNVLLRHIQFDLLHRAGRGQPKQLPMQLHAAHRTFSSPTMRGSVLLTHVSEGPFKIEETKLRKGSLKHEVSFALFFVFHHNGIMFPIRIQAKT